MTPEQWIAVTDLALGDAGRVLVSALPGGLVALELRSPDEMTGARVALEPGEAAYLARTIAAAAGVKFG